MSHIPDPLARGWNIAVLVLVFAALAPIAACQQTTGVRDRAASFVNDYCGLSPEVRAVNRVRWDQATAPHRLRIDCAEPDAVTFE